VVCVAPRQSRCRRTAMCFARLRVRDTHLLSFIHDSASKSSPTVPVQLCEEFDGLHKIIRNGRPWLVQRRVAVMVQGTYINSPIYIWLRFSSFGGFRGTQDQWYYEHATNGVCRQSGCDIYVKQINVKKNEERKNRNDNRCEKWKTGRGGWR
jgi:hypothetical protein